jgi:hypothetical protein
MGAVAERITFDDPVNGPGKDKLDYEKIEFCGDQAALDGVKFSRVTPVVSAARSNASVTAAIHSLS